MQVVEYVENRKTAKHSKGNETARITSCVEDGGDKDGENADDDDTGTETGEGDVGDKGGEIQT